MFVDDVRKRLHDLLPGIKCEVSTVDDSTLVLQHGAIRFEGRIEDAKTLMDDFAKECCKMQVGLQAPALGPWTERSGFFSRSAGGQSYGIVTPVADGFKWSTGTQTHWGNRTSLKAAQDACDVELRKWGHTLTEDTKEAPKPQGPSIHVHINKKWFDAAYFTSTITKDEVTMPENNDLDSFTTRFTAGILGEGLSDITSAFAAGAKTGAAGAFGVAIRNKVVGLFFGSEPPSIVRNQLIIAAIDITVPAAGLIILSGLGSAYDAQFGKPGMARAAKGACYWLLTAAVAEHSKTIVSGTLGVVGDLADFGRMMMAAATDGGQAPASEQPKLGVSLVPPSAEKERIFEPNKAVR
jgi:hypothetical protein